jgi:hypothetical protein
MNMLCLLTYKNANLVLEVFEICLRVFQKKSEFFLEKCPNPSVIMHEHSNLCQKVNNSNVQFRPKFQINRLRNKKVMPYWMKLLTATVHWLKAYLSIGNFILILGTKFPTEHNFWLNFPKIDVFCEFANVCDHLPSFRSQKSKMCDE